MERHLINPENLVPLLLAGNATLTVESKESGNYLTFNISEVSPKFYKVSYSGEKIGYLSRMKFLYHPKETIEPSIAQKGFAWLWKHLLQPEFVNKKINIYHHGICLKCGRKLTTPESIARGLGPECASILG